ncbi:MAG: DUF4139 domain-containing protein [Sedimentisphaerales bacterium]|nr:DUF4139 domain-containing protein [Sedimentisphaerales bacterium]
MNEHLTERQLIDYAYRLASDTAKQQTQAHLDACEQCRRALERLRARFASLELVRDEVQMSDALLARVVEEAAKPRRVAIFPYRHVLTIGATAAVFLVGVVWLVLHTIRPSRQAHPDAREAFAQRETRLPATPPARPEGVAELASTRGTLQPTDEVSPAAAPTQTFAFAAGARARAEAEGIAEQPPFAPASAIELVVLPRRENVQLTIYNSADLTLVRERRNLTLKRGWNWLQFMWSETLIDPTSLTLEPLEQKDRIEVQQLVFPPRLRELGRWLIRSETSGRVPFELTYLTSGLSWRAFYMGTLAQDEKTMRLESYVRVDNRSGEDYEDAQTRLIVGQVHLLDEIAQLAQRQHPYGSPENFGRSSGRQRGRLERLAEWGFAQTESYELGLLGGLDRKEVRKEGLSEYFLYTIEGTETIPNEWGKRLLSFEAEQIPVENLYKYDEERYGVETVRFLSFANDTEHKLGETPVPDGMVRIYGQVDAQAHLSYVGGTSVKYIPVGEEVELNLGPARLVKVEPTLVQTATSNYVFDSNDNITGWDEVQTWRIEVTNSQTLPAAIEITRAFDTPYWQLTSSDAAVAYAKYDATHARFTLSVEPRRQRTFDYIVTMYRGTRSEQYLKLEAEDER